MEGSGGGEAYPDASKDIMILYFKFMCTIFFSKIKSEITDNKQGKLLNVRGVG